MAEGSALRKSPPRAPPLPPQPTREEQEAVRRRYEAQEKIVQANMADYASVCRQKEMQFQLVGAIENEDKGLIRALIEEGVNTNAVILFTRTPLVHALEDGHEDIAIVLTQGGADVSMAERTFPYRNPVHIAALNGMVKALQELHDHGADVGAREATAMSPLHFAAWRGHLDTVSWLLQNGADKDAEDDFRRTPLHRAVEGNHGDVVDALLSAGADVNRADRFNWTALFHPVICDKPDMVHLLLSRGIDVNTVSNTGNTPLHAACARLRPVITKILLSASPDPVRRRKRIPFPDFEEDLARGDFTSRFEIIEALVDKGAEVNILNNESFSPLYLALFFGYNIRLVEFLVHAGTRLNNEPWLNQEIYRSVAVQKGFSEILQWLDCCRLEPPSLTKECRYVIRKSLGRGIRAKITHLPLPEKLKSYLNLEEFYVT
ncbi:poly [ADP-ribose] polymerase tankyrase-2-like [Liolophura sinensis]|uniref:poly [ADP-ribose] polymerase tankyrase-2-like n=1 Tax=Liolophura sinensis TaxID=3198878 RepID=UPI003158EFC7